MGTVFTWSNKSSVHLEDGVIRWQGVALAPVALADVVELRFNVVRGDGYCRLTTRDGKAFSFGTNRAGFRRNLIARVQHLSEFNDLVGELYATLARRPDVAIVTGDRSLAVASVITAVILCFVAVAAHHAFFIAILAVAFVIACARWAWRHTTRPFTGTALPRIQ